MDANKRTAASEFGAKFQAATSGDSAAICDFLDSFSSTFRHLIRYHLDRRLRSIVDSDDCLQEFWQHILSGDNKRWRNVPPDQLLYYFREAVVNIVRNMNKRYLRVAKRSLYREQHFSELPAGWEIEL